MKTAINGLANLNGNQKLAERNLSFQEYSLVDELIVILKPFQIIVTNLSSQKQITISRILPIAYNIEKKLLDIETDIVKFRALP